MYLKRLIKIFKGEQHRLILGRWSQIKEVDTFKRADLANNDHCGSCHYIDIGKEEPPKSNTITIGNEKKLNR